MIRLLAVSAAAGAGFAAGLVLGVWAEGRVQEQARLELEAALEASRSTAKYHAESAEMWRAEATQHGTTRIEGKRGWWS